MAIVIFIPTLIPWPVHTGFFGSEDLEAVVTLTINQCHSDFQSDCIVKRLF